MPSSGSKVDDLSKLELSAIEKVEKMEKLEKSKPAQLPAPPKAVVVVKPYGVDRVVLRVNKLFAPTSDLQPVLSTFNYSLYFLAYIDSKLSSYKRRALSAVEDVINDGYKSENLSLPEVSRFAKLGDIVYTTRMTLRLFGLFPVYVKMRKLMRGPIGGMDSLLHTVSVVQCSLYGLYQMLENIAFLTDNGILSKHVTSGLTRSAGGHAAALYKLAHRAWFLSVVCEFLRLFRAGQLAVSHPGTLASAAAEKILANHAAAQVQLEPEKPSRFPRWVRPLAWFPIAWSLSAWYDDDTPGLNMGVRGVAGLLADAGRTMSLWDATIDVDL